MTDEPVRATTSGHDSDPEPEHDRHAAVEATAEPADTDEGLPPEEEPVTTGTIFIMILFLMALAGMWGIMYLTLLEMN